MYSPAEHNSHFFFLSLKFGLQVVQGKKCVCLMVTEWWFNAFHMDNFYLWPIKSAAFKSTWIYLYCFPVTERCFLPPDVIYRDATGTDAGVEIFRDLVGRSSVVLTVTVSFKGRCNQALCIPTLTVILIVFLFLQNFPIAPRLLRLWDVALKLQLKCINYNHRRGS